MHPSKFLKRSSVSAKPKISDDERLEHLDVLGGIIAGKRKDAVDGLKESGIDSIWLACEEAYLGIDDMNRHEFAEARWAKPTSMAGPLPKNRSPVDNTRSNVFVKLTSRYVDHGVGKLCEILLPIDDKAFSLTATPVPDLIDAKDDERTVHHYDGTPMMRPTPPEPTDQTMAVQQPPPGSPPMQGGAMVPIKVKDFAAEAIEMAGDCAKKAETRIYDWMVESKYAAETRKVAHDSGRIGVGVLKGPFPDISESRASTKDKKGVIGVKVKRSIVPALKWVDPWNIFPDPACGENIHDGEYIFERDYLSEKQLRKLKDNDDYLPDQIDKVIVEGPGKIYEDGGSYSEKKTKKRYEIWYQYGTLKRSEFAVANEAALTDVSGDTVNAIVVMVNDTVIKAVLNPLDSGALPYRVMSWSPRPGNWAGCGFGESISAPQRMVNGATRALLNNAGLSSGVQIIIDQIGVVPADGSWTLTPNKIWYKTSESTSTDLRNAFFAVVIPSVQKEMQGIIEYGMKLAEESSGIPLVTQGQVGPTTPQTFGQAELQNNNSLTWLRSIGYRFDDMITEPLVNDLYEWLLLDPEVPDDEKGDWKINAHGSVAMVEKAIQEQTVMGLLSASSNPAFRINPSKLFSLLLKSKRIDPREVQYSEEEFDALPAQSPPIQLAVEQAKGQNAMQLQASKTQAELQMVAQQAQQEQQALQAGGTSPHMAQASARIEQERIRAATAQTVEQSRASAEEARAQKEFDIAQQNGQFKIQEMQLQKELAILQYAHQNQQTLDQVKADLAKTSIQEQTKRELASAEIQLAQSEGDKNRTVDIHKHATNLQRDMMTTNVTP